MVKLKPLVLVEGAEFDVTVRVRVVKDKTIDTTAIVAIVSNYIVDCLNEPGVAVEKEDSARKGIIAGDSSFGVIEVR